MPDHVPHYIVGPPMSQVASATVIGGRLVETTGNMTVGPAGAASIKVAGVAARDAVTGLGTPVFVNGVHDLKAAGAIAAGDILCAGAAGTVAAIGANVFGTKVGRALEAIADTATGRVLLTL
jgi:hypothetical protein